LSGQSEADAIKRSENIINDIIKATYYPPKDVLERDVEGVLDALEQLLDMFSGKHGALTKAEED
jgi:intracellular multiplication protein IcmO